MNIENENTNMSENHGSDDANKALVDALQICFRILKIIMICVVIMFFASGAFKVKPEEVALVTQFGKVVGTGPERERKPGFHLFWPEPVDKIIKIPKATQRSIDSEFWYHLTEQEKLQGRSGKAGASLVPGKDNSIITADANLLHVKINIKYRIVDAFGYVKNIYGAENPDSYPERELISSLADNAVIHSASQFTVDGLIGPEKIAFATSIKKYLDESLQNLQCGLKLDDVLITKIEPPRQVVKYFVDVRNAAEEMHADIQTALGDEEELLTNTAGPDFQKLIEAIQAEQKLDRTNDPKFAEKRAEVEELLDQSGGSVQEILADAKIYKTKVVASARADAQYLQALLPKYMDNPNVVVTRLLLGTIEKLLPKVSKWYIPAKVKEVRFLIDRDPEEMKRTKE